MEKFIILGELTLAFTVCTYNSVRRTVLSDNVFLDDFEWQRLDEYASNGCLHAGFVKQHKETYLLIKFN